MKLVALTFFLILALSHFLLAEIPLITGSKEDDIRFIEGLKYFFETYKQMATLASGSIIILAALLEKHFKRPRWKILISFIFLCFAVSLGGSVFGMWLDSAMIAGSAVEHDIQSAAAACTGISLFGYLIGITLLCIFAIRNFHSKQNQPNKTLQLTHRSKSTIK